MLNLILVYPFCEHEILPALYLTHLTYYCCAVDRKDDHQVSPHNNVVVRGFVCAPSSCILHVGSLSFFHETIDMYPFLHVGYQCQYVMVLIDQLHQVDVYLLNLSTTP